MTYDQWKTDSGYAEKSPEQENEGRDCCIEVCQYAAAVGMPEYRCANGCRYIAGDCDGSCTHPPRRCDTNLVGGLGECLACDAAQGQHCKMQPAAGETIRTTQHGSMEDASVTVQSAVDASSPITSVAADLLASLDPDALNPEQFNAWSALSAAIAKATAA